MTAQGHEGRRRIAFTVVAAVLALSGCGTRVTQGESQAPVGTIGGSGSSGSALEAGASSGIPDAPVSPSGGATPTVPGVSPSASGGEVAGAGAAVGRTTPTATGPAATGASAGSVATPAPAPGAGRTSVPTNGGPKNEPADGPASPSSGRSTVLVASVGTLSGPVGALLAPFVQGTQMWLRYANDRGGVNGHPLKLVTFDDGGDPARHRAQVQEAIERLGAIAFLSNVEGVSGRSSVDYVTSKRVPVIGSEGGSAWFYESPMFFPTFSSADYMYAGTINGVAQQLVPAGIKKFGTVVCAEPIQACVDADRVWASQAAGLGIELVYRGKASLAQPDFTAECLNARNSGAEAVLLAMDSSSVQRLAASCTRQGFRPRYAVMAGIVLDRFKDDRNLDAMAASSPVFPYFQSGTPATDEFQAALRTVGKGLPPGIGLASGWVTGKVFEAAIAHLPEPPTSAAVLAGLWTIKNNDLGGLTQPLTFVENSTAPPMTCWFNLAINSGAWRSFDNYKLNCRGER